MVPSASKGTTGATGMRRPRMQATPPVLSGSTVIRSKRIAATAVTRLAELARLNAASGRIGKPDLN